VRPASTTIASDDADPLPQDLEPLRIKAAAAAVATCIVPDALLFVPIPDTRRP
jgi:hypothetical protein